MKTSRKRKKNGKSVVNELHITESEWLDLMRSSSVDEDGDKGTSMTELSELWGVTVSIARTRVAELIKNRRVEYNGRKPHKAIDGIVHMVPCYRVVAHDVKKA